VWEHPGAELGCFFASLAVVGTWGDQPPSGVVGGGPRGTRHAAVPPGGGGDGFVVPSQWCYIRPEGGLSP
jgi:hypothetical protein